MSKINLDIPEDVLESIDLLATEERDRDLILNAAVMYFLERKAIEIISTHKGGVAGKDILTLSSVEIIRRYI